MWIHADMSNIRIHINNEPIKMFLYLNVIVYISMEFWNGMNTSIFWTLNLNKIGILTWLRKGVPIETLKLLYNDNIIFK